MSQREAEFERIVRSTIAIEFPSLKVDRLQVQEDEDFDGDPVLRIVVIYDSEARPEPSKVAGLIRMLRPRLLEHKEPRFPLVRLVSKADSAELSPEAA